MPPPNWPEFPSWDGAVGGLSTVDFPHTIPIATWVDFLLHPERHSYDRAEVYPDGSKVEVAGLQVGSADGPEMPRPTESVIAGNSMPQFFDFAVALTGQSFGEGAWSYYAFKALDDVRWRCDNDVGKLIGGFEDLSKHWQGSASERAGEYLGAISDFMKDYTEIAKELCQVVLAYAGVISVARRNLDDVMGKFLAACEKKFNERQAPQEKVIAIVLGAVVTGAMSVTMPGASVVWQSALTALLADVVKLATEEEGRVVGGDRWRTIVDTYFVQAHQVLNETREQFGQLDGRIATLLDRLARAPRLPA